MNSIKINLAPDSRDRNKVGLSILNSYAKLTEIYLENQDRGRRLGSCTLGVNRYGWGFIGSGTEFNLIDTASPEPHYNLLSANCTNHVVTITNLNTTRMTAGSVTWTSDLAPDTNSFGTVAPGTTNYLLSVVGGTLKAYWSDGVKVYSKQLAP